MQPPRGGSIRPAPQKSKAHTASHYFTMRATVRLLQHRQPMIKFIGRRHSPPASSSPTLFHTSSISYPLVLYHHFNLPYPIQSYSG
ncbi:MAG: hypothetical protein INR71_09625 [Terriglobus roseus]|nr:hypothetical protein [Terriglobus roseus]